MPLSAEVRRQRRAYNNPPQEPKTAVCENCGETYTKAPNRDDQRFCSDKCRKQWHKLGTAYPKVAHEISRIVSEELDKRAGHLAALESRVAHCDTAAASLIAGIQNTIEQAQATVTDLAARIERIQRRYDRLIAKRRETEPSKESNALKRRAR